MSDYKKNRIKLQEISVQPKQCLCPIPTEPLFSPNSDSVQPKQTLCYFKTATLFNPKAVHLRETHRQEIRRDTDGQVEKAVSQRDTHNGERGNNELREKEKSAGRSADFSNSHDLTY
ncbi:hypothetical protein HMPREF1981_01799 [Bacteroides pyogenes F0041]|uniref:Uncharacterized protein n=1 Tax=Bacteroides pyogenes F0041 TaxID=1321819 RepID=U2DZI8_9BACE|nr:hypothetical protein HMPREF1981_01799 [Bacteroides pyogenes F0041]